jgi:uncharacterized glyoxalase superfamily protein PhnB
VTKLFPTLRYRDPRKAVAWLDKAFGFSPHFVAEENGHVVHAQLRLGNHADDKYGMHSPLELNGTNQCVYIAIEGDIDAACRRAEEAGTEIVTAPYDTNYGSREFSCRDFEGHIWSIGSYAGEPLNH